MDLLQQEYAEDKIAAILLLQQYLLPAGAFDWQMDLPICSNCFMQGHITGWYLTDCFALKVLASLIKKEGAVCAQAVMEPA